MTSPARPLSTSPARSIRPRACRTTCSSAASSTPTPTPRDRVSALLRETMDALELTDDRHRARARLRSSAAAPSACRWRSSRSWRSPARSLKRPDLLIVNRALAALDANAPGRDRDARARLLPAPKAGRASRSSGCSAIRRSRTMVRPGADLRERPRWHGRRRVQRGRTCRGPGRLERPAGVDAGAGARNCERTAEGQRESAQQRGRAAAPGSALRRRSSPAKLKLLAYTSDVVTYRGGQILFRKGDIGDAAYVIINGDAEVSVPTDAGEIPDRRSCTTAISSARSPSSATRRGRRPSRARSELKALRIRKEPFLPAAASVPRDGHRDDAARLASA